MEWIKDVWLMTRDMTVRAFTIVYVALYVVALVFVILVLLKIVVAPLAPAITIFFVIGFTSYAIEKGQAVMSLGGIILYLASWSITSMWGAWYGMAVWAFGIMLWSWAVFRSVVGPTKSQPIPRGP